MVLAMLIRLAWLPFVVAATSVDFESLMWKEFWWRQGLFAAVLIGGGTVLALLLSLIQIRAHVQRVWHLRLLQGVYGAVLGFVAWCGVVLLTFVYAVLR